MQAQLVKQAPESTPVHAVTPAQNLAETVGATASSWAAVNSFKANKAGEVLAVPSPTGSLSAVLLGLGDASSASASTKTAADSIWAFAALPGKLPAGTYSLEQQTGHPDEALLGWILGEQGG